MDYDVFNGDADGICALHQLRLAEPRQARLVTGVKRDIRLLARLSGVKQARVTVLDISMAVNQDDLRRILPDCTVFYVDHHFAGDIPEADALEAHIDPRPDMCTSLIVDRLLDGRYRAWAVVGAFGDNLHEAARAAAAGLAMPDGDLSRLRELGELLNYNGYGVEIDDLYYDPGVLYEAVRPFADPLAFYESSTELNRLRAGFLEDMERAGNCEPLRESAAGRVYMLPAVSWARRVSGVFSNAKARERPDSAHALLVKNNDGTMRISVRAPLNRKTGADNLCRAFPSGGGRAAAAGINALPSHLLDKFLDNFEKCFSV